jgi:hypothetical protein
VGARLAVIGRVTVRHIGDKNLLLGDASFLEALLAADQLPAPPPLRKALHTIDIHLTETTDQARLLPKTA